MSGPVSAAELRRFIREDIAAHGLGGGAPWKLRLNNHLINFQIALRKLEYLNNSAKVPFRAPRKILQRLRYRRLSELYGFTGSSQMRV